ncbi:MAG: Fic family protein [Candidatus Electrothrix sp. GW3-4]|uniref:Fic family protein n=1 Tax=Candidatus Electrothrix sp. GW3-4 TaxID=3126740 RepID=UPI0030CAB85E
MNVTEKTYLDAYSQTIGNQIKGLLTRFDFSEDNGQFEYLIKASAVYSSNIEGNSVDLNSYMNYELSQTNSKPGKEIEEIENLIAAYGFAQQNRLTEANLLHCHKMFSATFLIKSKRGAYRIEPVGVFGKTGMAYLAVEPEFIGKGMETFFNGVAELIATPLTTEEVFYFAALLHLRFAHIHPFRDGNGRAARLLEKWFLAEKLGEHLWKIPSEQYYKEHQPEYYATIHLGVNFYELDYDKCIDFLVMLPNCLR